MLVVRTFQRNSYVCISRKRQTKRQELEEGRFLIGLNVSAMPIGSYLSLAKTTINKRNRRT